MTPSTYNIILRQGLGDLRQVPGYVADWSAMDAAYITADTVGRVSSWADANRRLPLVQALAGSQPIYLPWAGQNYGYCPGVTGNYFSTPDSVATSITGDIDLRADVMMYNWAALDSSAVAKFGAANVSYFLRINSSGGLTLFISTDGTALLFVSSTVATGFAAGTRNWVRATRVQSSGLTRFFTSTDGVAWTQLGADVTLSAGTSMFNGTAPVEVGARLLGTAEPLSGFVYRAQIYNGVNGTLAFDFNPAAANDGAPTLVDQSANAATITVNTSGGKPAQIVGRSSVLFDGVDDFLKTAAFTLNQPETVYFVGKQVGWTINRTLFDGNADVSGALVQDTTSPTITAFAGANIAFQAGLAIGAPGVVAAVFNGASSFMGINRLSGTIGAGGASNMGGFTIGARGTGSQPANIQASAAAIFASAHDARTRARVIDFMINRHRLPI